MPLRHQLLADADPEALCDETVAALRRGELCVLPTETVYGLAVLPDHEDAASSARALLGRADDEPATWHVADTSAAQSAAELPLPAQRLIERYWPGPLTVVVADQTGAGTVGLRLPSHPFTNRVLHALDAPLWLLPIPGDDGAPLADPAAIARRIGERIHLLVDDGPSPIGTPSTVVRATGGELEVLREGILTRAEVLTSAADTILFVCTGNTCRSPLAEAIAREATAQAMGVPVAQVLARGLHFASAGTATGPGMPASQGSLEAGAELGLDLSGHQSQPITTELCRAALRIYCLSDSHRQALLAALPDIADKVSLLRPDDLDIADPFGGELEVYRHARDEIRAAIAARLADWWP